METFLSRLTAHERASEAMVGVLVSLGARGAYRITSNATVDPWHLALVFTLLTSYMGTQAQAVGLKRNYGGLLGRADRMVLLLVIPFADYLWVVRDYSLPWFVSLLEVAMAYFALMGILTVVQRFVAGLRGFGPDGQRR